MPEEKKTDADELEIRPTLSTPQEFPAKVEPTQESAPIVLSQAPPIAPSDPKPVVDKASSIVPSPLTQKK